MGEVYLGEDTQLGRRVAVKLLPARFISEPERVRRFAQEARAASALNHPNIITIHQIGESVAENQSIHYIITEWVEGETLRRRLISAPHNRMRFAEALDIAAQVAAALTAAHEAGIVHRDIKPENIMLRTDRFVKVLDFGLAKLTERRSEAIDSESATRSGAGTEPGMLMGTVRYMSPEQARGQIVDARSDIFSLGVVLYEMIAGQLPFEGATTVDVLAAILDKEPVPLAHYLPEVPRALERLVSKALRKDREERYQTIKDLLIDLKDIKQDLEFEARLERTRDQASELDARGDLPSARASGQTGLETAPVPAISTDQDSKSGTTSGAQNLLREIRRHRRGVALTLVALVVVSAGIIIYLSKRTAAVTIDSIAVLPFVNQNNDPETEYLSDGLTESIINNLTQRPKLRVIARNSVFRYKGKENDLLGAGRELGVRAVVVGRALQRGEQLMVSVELVDVQENKQLWGQQYNRKLADVFAVQEEITREISEKLRLKLTTAEQQQLAKHPTENLKAYQYYIQGQAYAQRRTREDLVAAIRYYEGAIAEDRDYALAYAGLADVYGLLGMRGYIAPNDGRRKTEEAAQKALALDETLAEAHSTLGQAFVLFSPHNFLLGDRELRRAIDLSPGLASAHQYLGMLLMRQGRLDESVGELLKALDLDPLSPIIARHLALPYYLKREYARALELLRLANELGPPFTTALEVGVYIQNRLFDEALAELEKANRERKSDPILIYSAGMVYAAQGKRAEALRIIKELEELSGANFSQALLMAKIYAALNDREPVLRCLEHGVTEGPIGAFYKDDPVWDGIRTDPRFTDLLWRMGIPP